MWYLLIRVSATNFIFSGSEFKTQLLLSSAPPISSDILSHSPIAPSTHLRYGLSQLLNPPSVITSPFVHIPPKAPWLSISITEEPHLAAPIAAPNPEVPPPITLTS